MEDDLAVVGDEGRGKQRYAPVSRKQTLTRRFPNGATHLESYRGTRRTGGSETERIETSQ